MARSHSLTWLCRAVQKWVIDPTEEEECAGDARLILGLRIPKLAEGETVAMTEAERAVGKWQSHAPDIPAGAEFPGVRVSSRVTSIRSKL